MQPDNTVPNVPPNQPNQSSLPQPPSPAPIPQPAGGPVPGEPGTIVGTLQPAPQQSPLPSMPKKPRFKKSFVIAGVVAALVVLGGVAAAFYITSANNPEKLWKTALDNTSKGYDQLAAYSKDQQSKNKGGSVKGTFNIDSNDVVADGSLESKFDDKNLTSKIDLGVSGARFNAELLATTPDGAKNPDMYIKVSGVKGLDSLLGSAAPGLGTALSSFDNQWLVVDHTLLDQAEKEASQGQVGLAELSNEDITAVTDTFGRVNKEYLFTDNSSKAVFTVKQNIGKEQQDGRSVYHYKVGYDKNNLKTYVTTMKDELNKTKIKGYISNKEFDDLIKNVEQLDGNGQADVWVDTKTKLLRTIRFSDSKKPDNYLQVALNYTGGDEYPFVLTIQTKDTNSESKSEVKATLNTKSNIITLNANMDAQPNGQTVKMKLDATFTPSNDTVNIEKPANAKSLLEVYSQLLGLRGVTSGAMPPIEPAITTETTL